jgi:pyridoxamine 5'-phosphate oxidase
VKQFSVWYELAAEKNIQQHDAMALSTAAKNGRPSSRMVLLKGYDETGFVFFTNYNSRKGKELNKNPFASLLFYWPELHKQIRIEGKVKKISRKETEEYFNSRSLESRIGAWVSEQSSMIRNREVIEKKFLELQKKYEDGDVPVPPGWGGYRIIPSSFEFWESRPYRLHDRIRYRRSKKGWIKERLSP